MQTPKTPRSFGFGATSVPCTPMDLSRELKQVLNERNLLTAKTRSKVCSLLDGPSEKQRSEMDKRRTFRQQAVQEILNSEKTYLRQLEVLMKFFIIPLKENCIIDDASHTTLFGQIEMIYNLNGELLRELEKDLNNVAIAFLKLAPFFKLYSVYAFDYKNALFILQDLTSKNPVFRKFLQETETRPEVQTKLNSLMISPIQRVPRYKLLLEQVLLYTSPADGDYKILKESVKQIENTASHINSVIEDQEVTQSLLNLQNSLINRTPNIVKPSRKIIKEGVLEKVTRTGNLIKRYCVLMSDIFMYCKIIKDRSKNTVVENSLQCCCIFPLKKCKVYDVFPGNFKITCQGDGIILCTRDQHLGRSWVSSVKDAIDLHIQCRKTLRKESSKRTPMRKKDIKYFDNETGLSPNIRKCDYETVFRCKANSDSDDEDSARNFCFKMGTKVLKRKHEKLIPSTVTSKNAFTQENTILTSEGTQPRIKLQRTVKKCDYNRKKIQGDNIDLKLDDHDPTYGFANRFSNSKSFFRAHNVDSIIPSTLLKADNVSLSTNPPKMDALYPLRSTDHNSEGTDKNWLNQRNFDNKENNLPIAMDVLTTTSHKRVKFDDDFSGGKSGQPFPFYVDNNSKITILQKIKNFFSNLF